MLRPFLQAPAPARGPSRWAAPRPALARAAPQAELRNWQEWRDSHTIASLCLCCLSAHGVVVLFTRLVVMLCKRSRTREQTAAGR